MDESMGPSDTSCPVKYFDMVPDPGSYATEWRAKVRAANAAKAAKAKIVVGMRVKLIPGCKARGGPLDGTYKVIDLKPTRIETPAGVFRVPPRMIEEILPAE
jgi:hypothetical protein